MGVGDVARSVMGTVNFARCDGARREVMRGAGGGKVNGGRLGWGMADGEWLLVLTCPVAGWGSAPGRAGRAR